MEPVALISSHEIESVIKDWWRLADDAGSFYFSSPEWVLARWTWTEDNKLLVWRGDDGRVSAVLPLWRSRTALNYRLPKRYRLSLGVKAWANAGWPGGNHLKLLGDRSAIAAWAEAHRPLMLHGIMPQDSAGIASLSGATCAASFHNPYVLIEDHRPLIASKHLASNLRYYSRKLAQKGVTFCWLSGGDLDERMLETFFRLHNLRMMMTGQKSLVESNYRQLFAKLITSATTDRGLTLVVAERDGQPIAILLGFRYRHRFSYFNSGWDPAWREASLGTVLIGESIRLAAEKGVTEFDLMYGSQGHKYHFASNAIVDELWVIGEGPRSHLLASHFRRLSRDQ